MMLGNTTGQMGGWFRKEITSLEDLKGLKFRIAGLGGQVFAKLGVVTQQIAGGDLYPALEKGTIDAAEWVGPYDDEKLGLQKVAQFYYYPGFFEGCTAAQLIVNNGAYEALPAEYKAVLTSASAEATLDMISKYDARNAVAIKRLVSTGTQLRVFPRPVLEAAYREMQGIYGDAHRRQRRLQEGPRLVLRLAGGPDRLGTGQRRNLRQLHGRAAAGGSQARREVGCCRGYRPRWRRAGVRRRGAP